MTSIVVEMMLHLLVCCFILAEKILAQSCEDEILTFASAGRIEASTHFATVGDTVVVTCSSTCAWSWHTVLINGEVMIDGLLENEETKVSVGQVIMNCPNCKEPDEIDCNDPLQGPVVSVVNLTLLRSGDHYVQCIAHLFRPDSELWPENRLIAFPSRALKITGMEKLILSESSSVFHPTLTTSSIRMQSTASVHEATVNPVSSSASLPYNIGSATSIYESVSIEPVVSALMTNSPLSVVLKSSYFSSEEELRTTIVTLSQTIPSHNRNSNIAQSVTTSSSTGQSIDVLVPSKTVQAQADAQQSVAACSVFSEENTTIFVVLGIMTVVCVLLIAVIIVLMCVNRRNVTLNNHLNGNLQEQNLSLNLDEVKRVK